MYDPATETVCKGTVEAVEQAARRPMAGVHLSVKVGEETKTVLLGPSSFVSGKDFAFAKGDSVEVTGSKISTRGKEYIVAREVVKNGKTLTLRDRNGVPAWAGRGRGKDRSK